MVKVGLFIPCYINQFYPSVARATLKLLESLGCQVAYPVSQTCCGQPPANSGLEREAIPIYEHFVHIFGDYDYTVAPSGSCVHHVRHHFDVLDQAAAVQHVRERTLDIVEFMVDILDVQEIEAHFPHKVGLHQSCHGLRGLRLASPSELITDRYSKWERLLNMVDGLELATLDFADECCGFGGTFSVSEEAVSVKMGKDRILDHQRNGATFITSGDMSCLMHMDGILRRKKQDLQVIHLVEILASHE
ncbi:MAG: (Fe-S)-binding protein [Saprospiraceae bacterium]|nr:(Fe-S)-binding protein [Saprospiraceae bacterium]